ncbi:hypothetical protein, partial [Serratia marcescens]|uniref:hypothetical protein n=1 Tax=Serratia marcescens TaxID=615 RepID=UPI001F155786
CLLLSVPPKHQIVATADARNTAEASMVNLNSRIQHKYDLSGHDFSAKRNYGKSIFTLTILTLCLLAMGAVWI